MKNSTRITVKLALVFGITICLLIPQLSIMSLIHERTGYKYQAQEDVAVQWGRQQEIVGPILSIPFYEYNSKGDAVKNHAFFLPDRLDVKTDIQVQELEKGIYKIPAFNSVSEISLQFDKTEFDKWSIEDGDILWDQGVLIIGVQDPKGILNTPILELNSERIEFEPGGGQHVTSLPSMSVPISENFIKSGFSAEIKLELKGTKSFHLTPVGQSTNFVLKSDWPHPNFQGQGQGFAPVNRTINEQGFVANWKASKFNATYAYSWLSRPFHSNGNVMGVDFYQPADHYTKTERSVKYMVLIVGLIFLSFLLTELLNDIRIHPFQYILIGAAVVVFYVLLLAFSEYFGYNKSYVVSSISTIALISGYSITVFKNMWIVGMQFVLLSVLFVFLFVIINAMQYSLLMGAIGLFVILACTMFFTRRIQWYEKEDDDSRRD